jgi:hypothetical protein
LYQDKFQKPLALAVYIVFLGIMSIVKLILHFLSGNKRGKKLKKRGQVITSQTEDHSVSVLFF